MAFVRHSHGRGYSCRIIGIILYNGLETILFAYAMFYVFQILAIVLEGRRARNSRGRRRPSTANYRKLDCTLEEAVTSQCNANVTHVIY